MIDDTEEGFYKAQEVATILRISYLQCIKLLQSGKIKGVKVGGDWRVSKQEVRRILKEGTK